MKTVQRFFSFLAPLLAVGFIATAAQPASAQPNRFTPEVSKFEVQASDSLDAGSELEFMLEGTPRGKATVKLSGVNRTIVLNEVERGVYEGTYTIMRRDVLGKAPIARATLRVRNSNKVVTQALAPAAPAAPAVAALAIERFSVTPLARLEPGSELRFAAVGTPGARVAFTIDGIVRDEQMREVRPGRYEGVYTVRRNDNFPAQPNVVASFEANGQVIRSKLAQALVLPARAPVITNLAPKNNETVAGIAVSVSASFEDTGGGVDARSVKLVIDGQDVTRGASITPQFVTWRGDLRAGTHNVELTAADTAGNAVRQNWSFTMAGPQASASTLLPIEITSHANNTQVPSGTIEVRGRTAPDARVDVRVETVGSLAGYLGMNQPPQTQTVRADRAGNFAFNFQSQVPVPGARFDINVTAWRGDRNAETRLVLYQQR
jgi:hypothetical protein